MSTYQLHGVAFASSLDLPELNATSDPPAFTIAEGRLPDAADAWVDPWQRDPRGPWIRIQAVDGYRIRYQDQVDFHLAAGGASITVDVRECPPATVRHFLLDQVIPLALSTRALVLHASAVAIGDHLVAFTGPCGSGKSTIAALLARAGFPIAADDAMRVRVRGKQLEAVPAYPGVRLWPDMVEACALDPSPLRVSESSLKRRAHAGLAFEGRPLPLAAIYVLGEAGPAVTLHALSVRQTAMTLIEQGFRLEQRDPHALAAEMDRACDAAARVPAWTLGIPRDRRRRDEHVEAVVAHARSQVGVTCCS